MKPPKCRLCQSDHWLSEPHKFATNTATNSQLATNSATNTAADSATNSRMDSERGSSGSGEVVVAVPERTKNRRSKEAYNAYQREYMRKRRNV